MKRLLIISIILFVLLFGYDLFFLHADHPYFKWQAWSGFYGILGLLASILLMVFAKSLGRFFLYRNDDYYKDH
jgi:hypothetical protein